MKYCKAVNVCKGFSVYNYHSLMDLKRCTTYCSLFKILTNGRFDIYINRIPGSLMKKVQQFTYCLRKYHFVKLFTGITDKQVHHVASHIGKSQGVVTLLRGLPYNSSKGRIYLPRESLLKVGFINGT